MRHLFHSLIILLPFYSYAQPTKDEILAGLTEIKSIDIQDDIFTGYEVLSQKIGDARIVLLGEQTHGHGTTFTAKNKIIKYLVEKKGFDVVAFESSFFELNRIWDSDLGLTEKIDKVKSEIYPLWSASEELNPFFDFVKVTNENGRRLNITGFDCKHDMAYGQKYYTADFNSFLKNNKLPVVESTDYVKFKPMLDNLIRLKLNFKEDSKSRPKPEDFKLFNRVLDSIQSQLTRLPKTPECELWRQELRSLRMQATLY
jgi:erythromycin esterase